MIMHILKSNAMERCLPAILSGMLLAACSVAEPPREQLSVSIEPLSFLVRQITGDDFEINVLVPPAASPETYEPTPAQMKRVANSAAYVEIGLLDFEHKLERSIRENMPGRTDRPHGRQRARPDRRTWARTRRAPEPIRISGPRPAICASWQRPS